MKLKIFFLIIIFILEIAIAGTVWIWRQDQNSATWEETLEKVISIWESNKNQNIDTQYSGSEATSKNNSPFDFRDVDAGSFQRINPVFSKDQNGVYLNGGDNTYVKPKNMIILSGELGTRGWFTYTHKEWKNKLWSIAGADPETFQIIDGYLSNGHRVDFLAKDKDHVFWALDILKDADPKTIRVDASLGTLGGVRDADSTWLFIKSGGEEIGRFYNDAYSIFPYQLSYNIKQVNGNASSTDSFLVTTNEINPLTGRYVVTSDKYGFRFEYPKKYVLEQYHDNYALLDAENYSRMLDCRFLPSPRDGMCDPGIKISFLENPNKKSLPSWFEGNRDKMYFYSDGITCSVHGYPALCYEEQSTMIPYKSIFLRTPDTTIVVSISIDEYFSEMDEDNLQEIASFVSFTD